MTCEEFRILSLRRDNDEPINTEGSEHLASCPTCVASETAFGDALSWFRAEGLPKAPDLSLSVMKAIALEAESGETPVSIGKWFTILVIMIGAMSLSPIGATFAWLQARFGQLFLVPLFLTFGIAVTIYCACFIASHLDDLAQRWGIR